MTRGVWIALALLILACCYTAVTVARAARPGVINVTATRTHNHYGSFWPPGRQSDTVEQAWRITDRHGHGIGRMLLRCRWVLRGARLCDGELELPKGKITFGGSSPTAFLGEYAVTGGTGRFVAAGGVMRFVALGQSKNALLVTIDT